MKILIVCSGNAYRSPVAEALLKKLKPEVEVESAMHACKKMRVRCTFPLFLRVMSEH